MSFRHSSGEVFLGISPSHDSAGGGRHTLGLSTSEGPRLSPRRCATHAGSRQPASAARACYALERGLDRMDRKALARDYKNTPRPMGVYCVRNTVNGKAFLGTARDLPGILNSQRAQLRIGIAHEPGPAAGLGRAGRGRVRVRRLRHARCQRHPGLRPARRPTRARGPLARSSAAVQARGDTTPRAAAAERLGRISSAARRMNAVSRSRGLRCYNPPNR